MDMTSIHISPLEGLAAHYLAMPPVAAMRPAIDHWQDGHLRLRAPLAANVNDKGCAFGGSLVSLLTLASWGLVTLHVQQAGLEADVFVADSEVRYLAPLFGDLRAQARIAEDSAWGDFIATLRERGRARTTLVATVPLPDGGIATTFRARYVAILRKHG